MQHQDSSDSESEYLQLEDEQMYDETTRLFS